MLGKFRSIDLCASISSRGLVALITGATLFFTGPLASADDSRLDEVQASPQQVEIDGRTYGPEDGLVVESGSMALRRHSHALEPSAAASLLSVTRRTRGSSYVSTDHPTFISYVGRARAMANIYGGKRVVQAGFVYRRGGENVVSWQYSNATNGGGCSWSAGNERKKTVYDSLNPNAPTTTWHYSFSMINPGIC